MHLWHIDEALTFFHVLYETCTCSRLAISFTSLPLGRHFKQLIQKKDLYVKSICFSDKKATYTLFISQADLYESL